MLNRHQVSIFRSLGLPGMTLLAKDAPPPPRPPIRKRCPCGQPISDKRRFCLACRNEAILQAARGVADRETLAAVVDSTTAAERAELIEVLRLQTSLVRPKEAEPMLYTCDECGIEKVESRYPRAHHQCFECRTAEELQRKAEAQSEAARLAVAFAEKIPDQETLDRVLDAEPSAVKAAILVDLLRPYLSFVPSAHITLDCPHCGLHRGSAVEHECLPPAA